MNNIKSERVSEILNSIKNKKQITLKEYDKKNEAELYLLGYYEALESCEQLIKQ